MGSQKRSDRASCSSFDKTDSACGNLFSNVVYCSQMNCAAFWSIVYDVFALLFLSAGPSDGLRRTMSISRVAHPRRMVCFSSASGTDGAEPIASNTVRAVLLRASKRPLFATAQLDPSDFHSARFTSLLSAASVKSRGGKGS